MADDGGFTYLNAENIWKHISKEQNYPNSGTLLYVALYTTAPNWDDGTGSGGTAVEVTGAGYSRVSLLSTLWYGNHEGHLNGAELLFGPATEDWGIIRGWGIWNSTQTIMLMYGTFDGGDFGIPTDVLNGDSLSIPYGGIFFGLE